MLVEASGPASPDEVWRRFTTPSEWADWAPLIRAVDTTADVLAIGTTGRVLGVGGLTVDFEVTAVDPSLRSWTWDVALGPAVVMMDHHVLPAPGGGSRALLRVHPPAAPVTWVEAMLARGVTRRHGPYRTWSHWGPTSTPVDAGVMPKGRPARAYAGVNAKSNDSTASGVWVDPAGATRRRSAAPAGSR